MQQRDQTLEFRKGTWVLLPRWTAAEYVRLANKEADTATTEVAAAGPPENAIFQKNLWEICRNRKTFDQIIAKKGSIHNNGVSE